ncbi:MAG: zinc metallopeptidase [Bacteroidota bacterium]
MNGEYMLYMMIAGGLSMVGGVISSRLKSKFQKYSQVPVNSGLSGKQIAEAMLSHYNIHDVRVVEGQGFLTDHYNPRTKTISLSPPVYQGRSVSSAAVAAHECGHAIQHDTSYSMLEMRSALVPFVKFASWAQQGLLLFAFMAFNTFPQLMLIVIVAFAVTTMFSLVTLPVEFDASRRALVWLDETQVTSGQEHEGAKDALWWAAMTYVAAALSSLIMLVYLILKYTQSGRRR